MYLVCGIDATKTTTQGRKMVDSWMKVKLKSLPTLSGKGVQVDLPSVVRLIIHQAQQQHVHIPEKIVLKACWCCYNSSADYNHVQLSFDGWLIAKVEQVFFGVVPLNLDINMPKKTLFKPQSAHNVFPLMIINEPEEWEAIEKAILDLRKQVKGLESYGIKVDNCSFELKSATMRCLSPLWKLRST